ncbi:MAG: iron ABC transporter permease [Anaerolineae bacterium]
MDWRLRAVSTQSPISLMMRIATRLIFFLPLAFLAVFYFYPLAAILRYSFFPSGALDLSGLNEFFADPYYPGVLWFTIWQAAISTLLTLFAALPAAYILARYRFPGQGLIRALTTIPFLMPTIVVAPALIALLGPRGLLNLALMSTFHLDSPPIKLLGTVGIIFIAHIFYNFTIVLRLVGGFWANLDPQFGDAARVLGANRWRVWWEITLPLLAPAILAAALLVFIFDFTSFGVILILGGVRMATLEVEIYRQTANLFDLPLAAVLSLVQIVFTFILMIVYTRLQARLAVPLKLRPQNITRRALKTWRERITASLILTAMLVFLLTPLVILLIESFDTTSGLGLSNYIELTINRRGSITYIPPVDIIRNSLGFAALTVVLSVSLGLLAAYSILNSRRLSAILDPLFLLPLATSAVTLGFGYILALSDPPLDLRASPWIVPIAHTLIALPLVTRSVLPLLRDIKPNLREAAAVLGASPAQVWREVDLPIVGRAIIVGAVFAFTVSMGEFGATTLIARPEYTTIPLAIYRFLGQPGLVNYGQALALSSILMGVSALAIVLMERFRLGEAEF